MVQYVQVSLYVKQWEHIRQITITIQIRTCFTRLNNRSISNNHIRTRLLSMMFPDFLVNDKLRKRIQHLQILKFKWVYTLDPNIPFIPVIPSHFSTDYSSISTEF